MKQDSLDKILVCLFALAKHRGIACDDAKWITYHPKGKGANGENKGRKCLIDETTGQIIKGGPPNSAGKNIRQAFKDLKEQRKQAKNKALLMPLKAMQCKPICKALGLLGKAHPTQN